VSMVGLPPTAGFFSKWYLVAGAVDAGAWAVAVVIVGSSVLTLLYFLRLGEQVWFRPPVDDASAAATEAEPAVVGPIAVLAAAVIVLGLTNVVIVEQILDPVAQRLIG
jgi:multicomponent Na+:H+ antiporter subunit D